MSPSIAGMSSSGCKVVEGVPHEALLEAADATGADLIVHGARMGAIEAAPGEHVQPCGP